MEWYSMSCRRLAAPKTARMVVVVALLLAAPAVLAQPSSPQQDELWITLGNDAFEALRGQAGLPALEKLATKEGVVLSRARTRDLEEISARLHEATRRCGGFIAHRTLERAQRALEAAAEPVAIGDFDYEINQQPLVQSLEPDLQTSEILATIEHLSTAYNNRFHEHPSGLEAAQWIHDLWQGYALQRSDAGVELYWHPGINQPSVVLTILGTTFPDEVVVLGGHLDSIIIPPESTDNPNFLGPGADDDASGIATLSEVARVALAEGYRPQRTVQFMAYAAEEVGLVGSQDIAGDYKAAGVDVVAVLNLDMTDYFGSVVDIVFITDNTHPALNSFLGQLVTTYQPGLLWSTATCGYPCSDHASWYFEGYPAAMPFESWFGERNPWIHTTGDTVGNLGNQADHAYKFARLGLAFMVEIGNVLLADIFADGFEAGSTAAWSSTAP